MQELLNNPCKVEAKHQDFSFSTRWRYVVSLTFCQLTEQERSSQHSLYRMLSSAQNQSDCGVIKENSCLHKELSPDVQPTDSHPTE